MCLSTDKIVALPSGTRVRLIVPLVGSRRLETFDGTSLYLYDDALRAWRRLVEDETIGGWRAEACDLTDDDLWMEDV